MNTDIRLSFAPAASLLAAAGLVLSPAFSQPASACGGFWCSRAAPVDQASEEIIFIDNPDATVTAIIRINYEGPSSKFAWVIPIPGNPDVGVSSNVAFQRLDGATAPQYNLTTRVEGTCKQEQFANGGLEAPTASAAGTGGASASSGGNAIMVLGQGSVGPYDYTTIAVDPTLSDPADAAIQWFMDNGYDLTGVDSDLLGPYLKDGLNLLAFKLTKASDDTVGSIRPVVLTYDSELPMIPIRPTAVAAKDDMGIKVWIAADHQAVPKNYLSLVLNDALINWFPNYNYEFYSGTSLPTNYDAVVSAAADEAGGQGFVTELAAPMQQFSNSVFSSQDAANWQSLMSQQFTDGIDAIWAANNLYGNGSYPGPWDGWKEAIQASVTLPDGVSLDDFGRDPNAYRGTAQVDTDTFIRELYENLVKPAMDTQNMLNAQPYLTRLYSTMSADEMTKDPSFDYNADLADVSNIHTATQVIECSADVYQYEAPWRIELPQGGVVRGEGSNSYTWPVALGSQPSNLKVVQLSTAGAGQVVMDNSKEIVKSLSDLAASAGQVVMIGDAPPPPSDQGKQVIGGSQSLPMMTTTSDTTSGTGGSHSTDTASDRNTGMFADNGKCSVATPGARGTSQAAFGGAWVLLAAAWLRRRRRA